MGRFGGVQERRTERREQEASETRNGEPEKLIEWSGTASKCNDGQEFVDMVGCGERVREVELGS